MFGRDLHMSVWPIHSSMRLRVSHLVVPRRVYDRLGPTSLPLPPFPLYRDRYYTRSRRTSDARVCTKMIAHYPRNRVLCQEPVPSNSFGSNL